MLELSHIRNFAIISHVDHGKSTLADRFLEITGTVPKEKLIPQMLDQNPIERERGITIKLQPVRMSYILNSNPFILNLIDTPGHVDFSYEVSRSLAAVEGAILLVDGTQGIQAETVAKLEAAQRQGLKLIGAINKVDLVTPDLEERVRELAALLGQERQEIFRVSAKTGQGVGELLSAVLRRIPPPGGNPGGALRALVFDSLFDSFRGVVAFVRIVDGEVKKRDRTLLFHRQHAFEVGAVGYFRPDRFSAESLKTGEIGYIATGIKEPGRVRVGDTITAAYSKLQIANSKKPISYKPYTIKPLPGYEEPQPLVFASIYPPTQDQFVKLRDALERLRLNDAALSFEPVDLSSLGRGLRIGVLGTLHLEVVEERLRREFGLAPVVASPSVVVEAVMRDGQSLTISSAEKLPAWHEVQKICEPWVRLEILAPASYLSPLMRLLGSLPHTNLAVEEAASARVRLTLEVPFRLFLEGVAESLQSASSGFASFSYRFIGFRPSTLVRLDVVVAGVVEPTLARLVPRELLSSRARALLLRLKELIPRELFAVALQVVVEGKVIARETTPALKKDVTGYLYGGDITRKRKLWAKQKAGKARLQKRGRLRIGPEVFRALLTL